MPCIRTSIPLFDHSADLMRRPSSLNAFICTNRDHQRVQVPTLESSNVLPGFHQVRLISLAPVATSTCFPCPHRIRPCTFPQTTPQRSCMTAVKQATAVLTPAAAAAVAPSLAPRKNGAKRGTRRGPTLATSTHHGRPCPSTTPTQHAQHGQRCRWRCRSL